MLLYLASNSRPEIAYAVHQCARFTHNPKASHAKAVKRICRYLKGTRDQGMILTPSKECLAVDCYVDADFAGQWNSEDPQDPLCVKSRTGYVLMVADCPVHCMTPRSKHIAVKYHFFKEHVFNGNIRLVKVASDKQVADCLTKGLDKTLFQRARKMLAGW